MNPAIVIPTYNEKENIQRLVEDIQKNLKENFFIVIVDDQSCDGTGDIIKNLERSYQNVFAVIRKAKRSFAQSYIEGFQFALAKGATHCIEMDADGSHRVQDLLRMINELVKHPIVVGSRYCRGGKTIHWPLLRQCISRGGNIFARVTTGIPITDITSGFVGYSKSVLASIPYSSINCEGYSFQVEMKWLCHKAAIPLCEIPIIFIERAQGYSKMSSNIVREAMVFCLKKLFQR